MFSSDSKLARKAWNDSKIASCAGSRRCRNGSLFPPHSPPPPSPPQSSPRRCRERAAIGRASEPVAKDPAAEREALTRGIDRLSLRRRVARAVRGRGARLCLGSSRHSRPRHAAKASRALPSDVRSSPPLAAGLAISPLGRSMWPAPFIDRSREVWNLGRKSSVKASAAHEKGEPMKKSLMAVAAVATLAVSAVAVRRPMPSAARCRRRRRPASAAPSSVARSPRFDHSLPVRPRLLSVPLLWRRARTTPARLLRRRCVWQQQRFWDGYGWRIRRVRVCG